MPFALLIIGITLLVSAVRGTYTDLDKLVVGEFKGNTAQSNFLYWIVAILIVGMIGYVESLQSFSRAFLALIIIVLFLHNKGFFSNFFSGIGLNTNLSTGVTIP